MECSRIHRAPGAGQLKDLAHERHLTHVRAIAGTAIAVALTDPAIPFAITVNLVSDHLLGAG